MTTTEIAAEHGVSRQSIHAYRRTGAFPQPVEGEGSTRPRFRADEVAAFFAANPKQPGKKRSSPPKQQGESVTTTVDPRIAVLSDLSDPPYNQVAEKHCVPWDDAVKMLNAYKAAVLREAADAINALPEDYECDPGRGDAAELLRRMATEAEQAEVQRP